MLILLCAIWIVLGTFFNLLQYAMTRTVQSPLVVGFWFAMGYIFGPIIFLILVGGFIWGALFRD